MKGPTDAERARDETFIYGEVRDAAGRKVVLRLRTPDGYTLTADSAVTATMKVVRGDIGPGAYTPSMAFGADYVLELEGTRLISS